MRIRSFFVFFAALLIIMFGSCATSGAREKEKEIDFSVNMESPQINIGEVELQMHLFLEIGELKKHTAAVIYFPRENAVCVRFKRDFFTYSQFWDLKGREVFLEALEKYNDDYNERNLDSKDRKSMRKYGIVRGYLNWQQFSYTTRARGNMNLELGYAFKSRAPYFTITQMEAEYKDEVSRDNDMLSIAIPLYFTRAQASELAVMFDQDLLDGLAQNKAAQSFDSLDY